MQRDWGSCNKYKLSSCYLLTLRISDLLIEYKLSSETTVALLLIPYRLPGEWDWPENTAMHGNVDWSNGPI